MSAGTEEELPWISMRIGFAPKDVTSNRLEIAHAVPNDSDMNRAKNRRVELEKPGCAS